MRAEADAESRLDLPRAVADVVVAVALLVAAVVWHVVALGIVALAWFALAWLQFDIFRRFRRPHT